MQIIIEFWFWEPLEFSLTLPNLTPLLTYYTASRLYVCFGALININFALQVIDVDEELSKLQPSERLVEFYREKIGKLKSENQQMHHFLDR